MGQHGKTNKHNVRSKYVKSVHCTRPEPRDSPPVHITELALGNVNIQSTPLEWAVRKGGGGPICDARLNRSRSGAPIGQTLPFTFTEYSTLGLYMKIVISQFPTLVPAV